MIRELGESVGDAVLTRTGRAAAAVQERRGLPVDLLESEEAYLAVFDAPGASASDVQVRYVDGRILVRVERFREFHEGFSMRFPGRGVSLDGEVALPEDAVVAPDDATATLTDRGTLEVELPRVATAEVGGSAAGVDVADGRTEAGAESTTVVATEADADDAEPDDGQSGATDEA